jgi:predicted PurR-regulated permease PerM
MLVLLAALLIYRLRQTVLLVALSMLLAYVLHPVVSFLSRPKRISRSAASILVVLVLIILLMGMTTGVGFAFTEAFSQLSGLLQNISNQLPEAFDNLMNTTFTIGPIGPFEPYTFDASTINLQPILDELSNSIRPILSQAGNVLTSVAVGTASTISFIFLMLVITLYLLIDFSELDAVLIQMVPGPYKSDVSRLIDETSQVWSGFLRGQITLGLILGTIVALALWMIGYEYWVGMGIIAGITELVPVIGPFIAAVVGVIVALLAPTNYFGLQPWAFALLVLGIFFVIQQIENNLLVPKIIGQSLNLNPLIVLVGIIAGGTLGGFMGILLASPVIATGRLWLGYVYRKTVGLEDWPGPVVSPQQSFSIPGRQLVLNMRDRLRRLRQRDSMGDQNDG